MPATSPSLRICSQSPTSSAHGDGKRRVHKTPATTLKQSPHSSSRSEVRSLVFNRVGAMIIAPRKNDTGVYSRTWDMQNKG